MGSFFNGVFWLMPVIYWWISIPAVLIARVAIRRVRKMLRQRGVKILQIRTSGLGTSLDNDVI